jgi:hypothetical protein
MYFTRITRIIFIHLLLSINLHAVALSQTPASNAKPGASSISGRITIGGKPAVKKRVVVREIKTNYGNSGVYLRGDESREGKLYIGLTDAEGKYRVTGLPAGDYMVSVQILRSYAPAGQSGKKERQIHLGDDEERANIDFTMVKGGVITGRVTDSNGKPIIRGFVSVNQADWTGLGIHQLGYRETDDRGVYRIYGLPAGRYRVTAAAPGKSAQEYATTYYPDVTDEKQSAVIEVNEGSEVGNIDIKLSIRKKEGYEVVGRVIDAETGEPILHAIVNCSGIGETRDRFHRASIDVEGNFRLPGLTVGHYSLLAIPAYHSRKMFYSEPMIVEVTQGDVSGVEIKARSGGTISGIAVYEDDSYPALKDRLSQTIITGEYQIKSGDSLLGNSQSVKINSDGSFLLEGLPPVGVKLEISSSTGARPPLLLRIERNGVALPNSIEVKSGETVAGIRLVLTDKTATIRGQINFTGGGLPEGVRIKAFVHRVDGTSSSPSVVVDKNGRFVIEGLMDGEYSVVLNMGPEDGSRASFAGSQRVQVARGAETQVIFTLDLNEGRRKNDR